MSSYNQEVRILVMNVQTGGSGHQIDLGTTEISPFFVYRPIYLSLHAFILFVGERGRAANFGILGDDDAVCAAGGNGVFLLRGGIIRILNGSNWIRYLFIAHICIDRHCHAYVVYNIDSTTFNSSFPPLLFHRQGCGIDC